MELPTTSAVVDLYDANRFVDAYGLVSPFWGNTALVDHLEIDQIVLVARLARRLGSDRAARGLLRVAKRRAPDHPMVRYYCRYGDQVRPDLLAELRDYEARPMLETDDPGLQANWLSSQAIVWAVFRDFEKAHNLVDMARRTGSEKAWISACHGYVHLYEHAWDKALASAEDAIATSPGLPAGLDVLGRALTKLGRIDEAAERIASAAPPGQSFENVSLAAFYSAAAAERARGEMRNAWAEKAYGLAGRILPLAPLADRETRTLVARRHIEAALLLRDPERIRAHGREARAPFYERILENLDRNGNRESILLDVNPVFQTWDTCVPASLATALSGMGIETRFEDMAKAMTYGGTPMWRARKWAEEEGLSVASFNATPEIAQTLLEEGIPFVLTVSQDLGGHALAVIGLDSAAGTLLLHDPSSDRLWWILLDEIASQEAPFGPDCLVAVPTEKRHVLSKIPAAQRIPAEATERFFKAHDQRHVEHAAKIAVDLAEVCPDHPVTKRLDAVCQAFQGRMGDALEKLKPLLAAYPDNLVLRNDLLNFLPRFRNTALILDNLEAVVERRLLPGTTSARTWQQPPISFISQYADYLRLSAATRQKGLKVINRALRRNPLEAMALHVLGDLLWDDDRLAESVLPYRTASSLNPADDHFAAAAAEAMRRAGDEVSALAFLKNRCDLFKDTEPAGGAWVTWVTALRDTGQATRAVTHMKELESKRPSDAVVAAFAVRFWTEMGDWERAEAALERAGSSGEDARFLEARVAYLRARGDWAQALTSSKAWVNASPENLEARRALLEFLSQAESRTAALDLAGRWCDQHEGHEGFEMIRFEWQDLLSRDEEILAFLDARLDRNPHDPWAWAELGHRLLSRLDLLPMSDRAEHLERVKEVLAECEHTAPTGIGTLTVKARLASAQDNLAEAAEATLQALDQSPDNGSLYDNFWNVTENMPAGDQTRYRAEAEARLLRTTGHLHAAGTLANHIAERFGIAEAEASVTAWQENAPDDPELIEAKADVLLRYGKGREDAGRVLAFLEPAIDRFPHHLDLRLSLAHAANLAQCEDREIDILKDALRWAPTLEAARRVLSRALARAGKPEEGLSILEEGCALLPLSVSLRMSLVDQLVDLGRREEAAHLLRASLQKMPEAVGLRERAVNFFLESGAEEDACEVARKGTEVFPDGSYMWCMLGNTLSRARSEGNFAEAEAAYRKALERNAGLFQAADELAVLYTRQMRFDDARAVLEPHKTFPDNRIPAGGRSAWILRKEGKNTESRAAMAELLKQFPNYEWGWRNYLDWIEDDKAYDELKSVDELIPAPILDDPEVQSLRLCLLAHTDMPVAELDAQWAALLGNFPSLVPLHLARFDELWEAERKDEAGAILDPILKQNQNNPYVLARAVKQELHRGNQETAVEMALGIFELPGDEEVWPEIEAGKAVKAAKLEVPLFEGAVERIVQGRRLRRWAGKWLADLAAHMDEKGKLRRQAKTFRNSRIPWEDRYLEALRAAPFETGEWQAAVLSELLDRKETGLFLADFKKHEHLAETSIHLWQEMGRGLMITEKIRECRAWFAEWEAKPQVEMWALAYYVMSLHRHRPNLLAVPADPERYMAVSRDALSMLPHDGTAPYMAVCYAEGALRIGDDDAFRDAMDRYSHLVEEAWKITVGRDSEYWYPGDKPLAPHVLLALNDLQLAPNREKGKKAIRRLIKGNLRDLPWWVPGALSRFMKPQFGRLPRMWARLRLFLHRL